LVTLLPEGFSHFVTSMTAPVASGGSEFAGWGLHHWKAPPLARLTRPSITRDFADRVADDKARQLLLMIAEEYERLTRS
jgi:hypothetical protein